MDNSLKTKEKPPKRGANAPSRKVKTKTLLIGKRLKIKDLLKTTAERASGPTTKSTPKPKPRIAFAKGRVEVAGMAERFLSALHPYNRTGAVQGAKRRSEPLTARIDPGSSRARGKGDDCRPEFPFWPSWNVYDSRLPAAMQRFSHCCQVRYSFRCRSGLRMLADHGVPAKPEGPLATPLPRRPSATRVRWLFRAVDVTLRAQVAPKSAAACRRTTSGSDAPPQAATNNIARASRAARPSSSADAASSSATSF